MGPYGGRVYSTAMAALCLEVYARYLPLYQMGDREAIEKYVSETIPMGRWATIDEIAESILFLASDRSSFMTGHALVVDGGECIA